MVSLLASKLAANFHLPIPEISEQSFFQRQKKTRSYDQLFKTGLEPGTTKNAVGDDESEDHGHLSTFSPSFMLGNLPLTTLMALHAVMEVLQHVFGQTASFLYELTGER